MYQLCSQLFNTRYNFCIYISLESYFEGHKHSALFFFALSLTPPHLPFSVCIIFFFIFITLFCCLFSPCYSYIDSEYIMLLWYFSIYCTLLAFSIFSPVRQGVFLLFYQTWHVFYFIQNLKSHDTNLKQTTIFMVLNWIPFKISMSFVERKSKKLIVCFRDI